jgi:hypothetical protein
MRLGDSSALFMYRLWEYREVVVVQKIPIVEERDEREGYLGRVRPFAARGDRETYEEQERLFESTIIEGGTTMKRTITARKEARPRAMPCTGKE